MNAPLLSIPTFAVVGAVNHGKSSVLSTLAENDQVRISPTAGETVVCQLFHLKDLFAFYDTPGFQNPLATLDLLQLSPPSKDPLTTFRSFLAKYHGNDAFTAECHLLKPIVEGAGIIYVVDGSEPLTEIHQAEMEILRLTGQPRLAIINPTHRPDHVQDWKRQLSLHFNAIREFNAHHATFADRIELLEALAEIEQNWKPRLKAAIKILENQWADRLKNSARLITDLLSFSLGYSEVGRPGNTSATDKASLESTFATTLRNRETLTHTKICACFEHRSIESPQATFDHDLFSEETWKAFGLTWNQLIFAGAIAGAAAGVAWDMLTFGHALGIPTIVGTATGTAVAIFTGTSRPEIKVNTTLLGRLHLGGTALSVGPYKALDFPWILLDRAFATFCYLINRTHARQDRPVIFTSQLETIMKASDLTVAQWSDDHRQTTEKIFQRFRSEKVLPNDTQTLSQIINDHLHKIATTKTPGASDAPPESTQT
ncbi:MAG: GTPase/DUF3482 domain-containing protein [Verrucomicrobia bacterium]|nr:GTPase/DUF3482 domain-containing protein [Verrucomicrobiota bacterium]